MITTGNADQVLDAYLSLMGRQPFGQVSMSMVAAEAGLSLGDLRRTFASEEALLEAFAARADAAMLDRVAELPRSNSPRERVLAAMLARFEILAPYRAAVRSILIGAARDPAALMFFARVSTEEHRWTLIAAGLDHRGAGSRNLAEAISQAFVASAEAWLEDDAALSGTRSALAKALPFQDEALGAFVLHPPSVAA